MNRKKYKALSEDSKLQHKKRSKKDKKVIRYLVTGYFKPFYESNYWGFTIGKTNSIDEATHLANRNWVGVTKYDKTTVEDTFTGEIILEVVNKK